MEISKINGCIILPTFNNAKTLKRVIDQTLDEVSIDRILLVNDGSTDDTTLILEKYPELCVLSHFPNKGKGFALQVGFKKAIELGFDNAITLDTDGQHFPSDLPKLIEQAVAHPGFVLMGSRNMEQAGVPQKSSFGNKFSNFWFHLETGIKLPDTQTGFRLYPLEKMREMKFFTRKFEFEIELIVRLAWKGVLFKSVPVQVKYDPDERVSHFRPGRDFFRISVLNSVLVLVALFYYYPKKMISYETWQKIKQEAIKPEESNLSKSLSLAFGVFMGIIPIWGFQLLVGIPLAVFFRMNKVLFILAANISFAPFVPFIIYVSFLFGHLFLGIEKDMSAYIDFSMKGMQANFYIYVWGAIFFAIIAFVSVFLSSFLLLQVFRKKA